MKERKNLLSKVIDYMMRLLFRNFQIIILVLFFTFGCDSRKEDAIDYQILGSWSFCDGNGSYNEVHIFKDSLIHCLDFDLYTKRYPYKISGDSMILYNFEELVKSQIKFLERNQLKQTFNSSEQSIVLTRIEEEVVFPRFKGDSSKFEYDKNFFELLFKRRKKLNGCDEKKSQQVNDLELDEIDTAFKDPFK